jgi:hypothetical protein
MSNDRLLVYSKPCDQCLFSDRKIVSDDRKDEVIDKALKDDTYFVCHKSDSVCCHNFYKLHQRDTLVLRLANILGVVTEVELPAKK